MQRVNIAMASIHLPTTTTHEQKVRTMTVEEGHILNIDGDDDVMADHHHHHRQGLLSADHAASAKSARGQPDRVSVISAVSGRSAALDAHKLPWYRGITFKDVRDITPTLLILLGGLLIMIFVIPYAFSSVIKQLRNEGNTVEAVKNATDNAANEANATMIMLEE